MQITSNDTAIIAAYPATQTDLIAYGGSETGYIANPVVQEIDISIGEAIFTWYALDHVDPSESYAPFGTTETGDSTIDDSWDYFVSFQHMAWLSSFLMNFPSAHELCPKKQRRYF